MGAFASRENAGVEELDIPPSHAYRYPPKSGCYFGSYFIMGGERFESTQPEAYLFGENQDLNFLGSRPLPFPYPAPQSNEPTKTIKSLVNIRKDSLRLVRVVDDDGETEAVSHRVGSATSKDGVSLKSGVEIPEDDEDSATSAQRGNGQSPPKAKYNIEFTFDADARCAITILYFASETIESNHAIYMPRDVTMSSETYRYKKGANQLFVQASHVLEPGRFPDEDWQLSPNKDVIPIVIQCVVEDDDHVGHSHMTFACVERVADGYTIKALKQKQMVDGLCYLLQEIYGIENKKAVDKGVGGGGIGALCDDETDDNGSECVICMSDVRDTLILPCRHLCLCNGCADSLRYQANNCPICRAPFRALLQIRAMRKKTSTSNEPSPDECPISQEGCPPGYEAISLIEALNGPATPTHQVASSEEGAVVPSAPLEALASGGSSRASAAKVKRRVSRTGSERASVRSASGNPPTLGADIQPTTPSTTPLLHHPAGATSLPSKTHEVAHGSPVVVSTQNERGACGSDCIRRSLRSSSAKESGVSVPRCQSLEEESDFAIVSIPARRARIAKMGEDVESLGSTMSESPSRDVVVAKTTTVNVSPTLSMCGIDSSGCDEEDESDEEDPSPTPPMDEAPTPTQPATPIGAVEEEHLKTPISTAPVAADV